MNARSNDQGESNGRKLGYLSWADREETGKRVVVMRKTARMAGLAGFALLLVSAIPMAALSINEIRQDNTRTVYVNLGGGVFTREVAPERDYVLEKGVWVPKENVIWLKLLYVSVSPALLLLFISLGARSYARRMRRPY
jgi:hypothetical protein